MYFDKINLTDSSDIWPEPIFPCRVIDRNRGPRTMPVALTHSKIASFDPEGKTHTPHLFTFAPKIDQTPLAISLVYRRNQQFPSALDV